MSKKENIWKIYFSWGHLPEPLRTASKPFCQLAFAVLEEKPDSEQREKCLQHLLDAKDCAVRSLLPVKTELVICWKCQKEHGEFRVPSRALNACLGDAFQPVCGNCFEEMFLVEDRRIPTIPE